MIDKNSIILKFFQKEDKLTINNSFYKEVIVLLFNFLCISDNVDKDKTSNFLDLDSEIIGKVVAKEQTIVAGIEEIVFLLKQEKDLNLKPLITDGEEVKMNEVIIELKGKAKKILSYERVILNILQRLSGIASETRVLKNIVRLSPKSPFIAATRKTPWTFLDKKAVAVSGGLTHRLSLSDGLLVKDNHLLTLMKKNRLKEIKHAIPIALKMMLSKAINNLIEIEVETQEQAEIAVICFKKLNRSNYLCLMLDNFSHEKAKETINFLYKKFDLSDVIIEASGDISKKNIKKWADIGADILSLGSLTHSVVASNLSMTI